MSRLPDFLVIGAMKAGTTSLYQYLRSHPQIFMAQKELSYFSKSHVWELGPAFYESQFEAGRHAEMLGEVSPSYSRFPEFPNVPARIFEMLPRARFIYLLREPIDRMRSHYGQRRARGRETRSVERALIEDPTYIDASRYALQIERYLEYFDRSRILLVQQDDLRWHRPETMRMIFEFLGVAPDWQIPANSDREYYRSADKRWYSDSAVRIKHIPGVSMLAKRAPESIRSAIIARATRTGVPKVELSEALRRELSERLASDVTRLRALVGPDFDGWGIV